MNKPEIGTILTCPICGKEFKYNKDCTQKLGKEYVCTWKCFLKYVRKQADKEIEEPVKRRGRPRKNDK